MKGDQPAGEFARFVESCRLETFTWTRQDVATVLYSWSAAKQRKCVQQELSISQSTSALHKVTGKNTKRHTSTQQNIQKKVSGLHKLAVAIVCNGKKLFNLNNTTTATTTKYYNLNCDISTPNLRKQFEVFDFLPFQLLLSANG